MRQQRKILLLPLFLLLSVPCWAGQRLALVIGNGAYADAPLKNPVNDAADMAAKLEAKGFGVTTLTNAGQKEIEKAVREFTRQLGQGDVGLFYFAGHGVQVDGENYLAPVDADIQTEEEVRYEAVSLGRVVDGMKRAGNDLNLVVLDACRNNPYSRSFRSGQRGLARVSPATGTLILYATEPGQVAVDGEGRNGVFTEKLLASMDSPGLGVEQVFKETARQVHQATGGRQTPWQEGVILGQFAFDGQTQPPPPADAEWAVWQSMERCGSAGCFHDYLRQYPQGRFRVAAEGQLTRLEQASSPPAEQEPVQKEGTWADLSTAFDRRRIESLQGAWATARAQMTGLTTAEKKLVKELAEGPSLPLESQALAGTYRCRTLKAGGGSPPLVIYDWFKCRIRAEGEQLLFEKTTGSQRTSGKLYPWHADEMIYLGALYFSDEQSPGYVLNEPGPNDSCNEHRNEVALLRRIGKTRYLMTFPKPLCESDIDVIELVGQ